MQVHFANQHAFTGVQPIIPLAVGLKVLFSDNYQTGVFFARYHRWYSRRSQRDVLLIMLEIRNALNFVTWADIQDTLKIFSVC